MDDACVGLRVFDWKTRELCLAAEPDAEAALRDRVVGALVERLTISPLAPFQDRLRYDEEARRAYRSDGATAFAELQDGAPSPCSC